MRGPVLMVGAAATLSVAVVAGSSGVASADSGIILPSLPPLPSVSLPIPTPTISLPTLPLPTQSTPGSPGAGGSGGAGGTTGGTTGGGGGRGKPATSSDHGRPARGRAGAVQPMVAGRPDAAALTDDESSPALRAAGRAFLAADRAIARLTRARDAIEAARSGASRAATAYRALQIDASDIRAAAQQIHQRSDDLHALLVNDARRSYQTGRAVTDDRSTRELVAAARRADDDGARAEMALGSLTVAQSSARDDFERYAAAYRRGQAGLGDIDRRLTALAAHRAAALAAAQQAKGGDLQQNRQTVAESGRLGAQIRAASARLAASGRTVPGTGHFVRPSTGAVTSPYGQRYHPILHYVKLHTGTDFAVGDGFAHAADRGRVLFTVVSQAYGYFTVIDHGTIDGRHITTAYAHQARFLVRPGEVVAKGQRIGVIGSTGYATGPHLHFEVRDDGAVQNPMPWLP